MNFSLLALLAPILAEKVSFSAVSTGGSVEGGLVPLHEGAGFGYFFLNKRGAGEVFSLDNGVASTSVDGFVSYVGVAGGYLSAGPAVVPMTLDFDGDDVTGRYFWACKNTGDPYDFSANYYAVLVSNAAPFHECTAVTISKHAVDGTK